MSSDTIVTPSHDSQQLELFRRFLFDYFGKLDEPVLNGIIAQCEWLECEGGDTLFSQGDAGNAAYFLISGRLRAIRTTSNGIHQHLGDIKPGETVGEVAVLSDDVRGATILATRDSVVVRIATDRLHVWFMQYPKLLLQTAKLIIQRTNSRASQQRHDYHVTNITILPLSPHIDLTSFRIQLCTAIESCGTVLFLDPPEVERQLGEQGVAFVGKNEQVRYRRLSAWLDTQEDQHDYVIYMANASDNAWTQRCLRQADRVLLLADANDDCTPPAFEITMMDSITNLLHADTMLVLWHPTDTIMPRGTAHWLNARPWVGEVIHIRRNNARHMARLARLVTGNAIGLVLGSGGARGLAAVGVIHALEEAGIPIDRVGGTSIGSIMAAAVALDDSAMELSQKVRHSFQQNPTKLRDLNILPILSIFQGKRLHGLLQSVFPEAMHIEDLWINFFCISSDMATNTEVVHTRGSLWRSVCASAALPGVFPMVRLGDGLHVDGAFMNALPVDVMDQFGAKKIIAVDFSYLPSVKFEFADMPSPVAFLMDKFFNSTQRRFRVPTLMSGIIQSSLLASSVKNVHARANADLLFSPDLRKFDLLAWSFYDALVKIGFEHARTVLAQSTVEILPRKKTSKE